MRKFEDIAARNDSPSARFDVRKDMNLLEFQQRLLLEAKAALSLHEKLSAKARDFLSGFDVSMGYSGMSVKKIGDQTIDFRQKLLEMWGGLKDSIPAVLVMLDNAEGLKQISGANEELRNTFQRLSEYDCKYVLIIADSDGFCGFQPFQPLRPRVFVSLRFFDLTQSRRDAKTKEWRPRLLQHEGGLLLLTTENGRTRIIAGKPDLFAGITSIYEPFARFFNFIEPKPFSYEERLSAVLYG